jgi:signal transduction histidine kinase
MRSRRDTLWPAAFAFGLVAELAGRPPLPVLDGATGFSLLLLGLVAQRRQPRYTVGWILASAGVSWFISTLGGWAVFVHRAPLAQLILTYPARRPIPGSRVERLGVAAAYAYAITYPVANDNVATIAFAVGIVGLAAWRYLRGAAAERRARASALLAALAVGSALAAGAALSLGGSVNGHVLLALYEVVVMLVAAGLTADLLAGGWTAGLVTSLVVDLGEPATAGPLRDRLARALGDPTLVMGYWIPERRCYVDEAGTEVQLPAQHGGRVLRLIDDGDRPLAALVHDPAVLDQQDRIEDIAAAARLAIANARLQAEIRARVAEVEASRRRLIEAADEQRRQLERELREGAERRLTAVAKQLGDGGPAFAELEAGLEAARNELRELAHGIHPATLTSQGLLPAVDELCARSPVPVEIIAPTQSWPRAIETAAYFACSEALTNVAKYARATRVQVRITSNARHLRLEILDDGVGGADPARGSGLRGLADRVDTLGGSLTIQSAPGRGTRLTAELPLARD